MSTSSSSSWLKPWTNPPNRSPSRAAACSGFYTVKLRAVERKPMSEETREKFRQIGRSRVYTPEQNARNAARQQSLNAGQVKQIKQMLVAGMKYSDIAQAIGCSVAIVGNIKRGQAYKNYESIE